MDKLRKVQLNELDMLIEVDRITQKYKLSYNLAYGTFLGAIRHNGFIPWDDDLDINMSLSDFKKFEKICETELAERFFLQTPKTDRAPFPFYKMRVNGTLMIEDGLRRLNMHHGIWIDIFPYVYASNNFLGKRIQILCLNLLNRLRARYYYENSDSLLRRLLCKLPVGCVSILDNLLLLLMEKIGTPNSKCIFELSRCKTIKDNFFDSQLFEKIERYTFEEREFWGPADYDSYLTKCYGSDYMTPIKYAHIKNSDDIQVDDHIDD